MKQSISILGSTGSIGRQSLEVIAAACGDDAFSVTALTANRDTKLMEQQCRAFSPEIAVMADEKAADDLRIRLADTSVKVLAGEQALCHAATMPQADTVITAVVGMVGLRPTLAAIEEGKRIALANKETLVCAGELVMQRAKNRNVQILPVDSEHSAIFQSLQGCTDEKQVKRIILTCSGGPFFGRTKTELKTVTRSDALKHPNWEMGAKITIDSATLMNKGLEFIEAMHLFSVPEQAIDVVIHRESMIHSMVEYCDNSVIAQMGAPDMRLPIQYALTYPARTKGVADALDLFSCKPFTFAKPDMETFSCLALAKNAAKLGGTAGAILNGANEWAVAAFLAGEISFLSIAECVEYALGQVEIVQNPSLESILDADTQAREAARRFACSF